MAEAEKGDRLPAAERKRLKKEPDGEGRMAKRVTKRYKKHTLKYKGSRMGEPQGSGHPGSRMG